MTFLQLTKEEQFTFDIIQSVIGLIGGVLSIYFIQRWGTTLGKVDDTAKEMLLGTTLNNLLKDDNTMLTIIAIYVGIAFFKFMIYASSLKQYLENSRNKIIYNNNRNIILKE